jgi:hypothetical protein
MMYPSSRQMINVIGIGNPSATQLSSRRTNSPNAHPAHRLFSSYLQRKKPHPSRVGPQLLAGTTKNPNPPGQCYISKLQRSPGGRGKTPHKASCPKCGPTVCKLLRPSATPGQSHHSGDTLSSTYHPRTLGEHYLHKGRGQRTGTPTSDPKIGCRAPRTNP